MVEQNSLAINKLYVDCFISMDVADMPSNANVLILVNTLFDSGILLDDLNMDHTIYQSKLVVEADSKACNGRVVCHAIQILWFN